MVPVIVEVTVRTEVIAPSTPAGVKAVMDAMNKAFAASNDPTLARGKFKVLAYEKQQP